MLSFIFRNLVSLAIFYVLPVIQLVITYQSVSASALFLSLSCFYLTISSCCFNVEWTV